MPKGKRAEQIILGDEQEIVTPEMEKQAEIEIQKEKEDDIINDDVRKLIERARQEGGSVIVKLKKLNEVQAKKIGKYKANEFDEDLIAKQYGGGTYFYTLRDEHGRIRGRWEEEYAEPEKKEIQTPQTDMFVQMSTIIKDLTKEISNIKAEINKPKDDTAKETVVLEMMKDNQKNQIDLLKAIATSNTPKNQPSLTEMMSMFTAMFGLLNKMNMPQPTQQQQPQNTIKDVVELASLFADMKESGNAQPETFMDTIKTLLTDGSIASVIAMLKQPKAPMIKPPQQQQTQQLQEPQPTQEEQDTKVVCEFFKQYEKQLFQMKVDGNNAENIAGTILSVVTMNNDFKVIAYRFFRDVEKSFNSLYENSVEFKSEKEFLKEIVGHIHKFFYSQNNDEEETQETNSLPQGEIINEE